MSQSVTVAELKRRLERQEPPPPVLLLLGEEAALRSRALELLRAPFESGGGQGSGAEGAVERLDGSEVSLEEILDEARSLPLFAMMASGPAKLVHVSRFDSVKIPEAGALQRYLEEPVAETVLALDAAKLDKRKSVYKLLAKHAVLVPCDPLESDADARRWVQAMARANGCEIDRAAVVYLTEMTGTSLTRLEQELEKAILYVGEAGRIGAEDLEGLLGRSREHSVFELTDALVRGDAAGAQRLLNRLVDDGEDLLRLLAMIAWITRQLVTAADLATQGLPRKELLGRLAGRWNQRGQILDRARQADTRRLVDALASCGDADLFVKRLRSSRPGADKLRPARGRLEALCRQICAA